MNEGARSGAESRSVIPATVFWIYAGVIQALFLAHFLPGIAHSSTTFQRVLEWLPAWMR